MYRLISDRLVIGDPSCFLALLNLVKRETYGIILGGWEQFEVSTQSVCQSVSLSFCRMRRRTVRLVGADSQTKQQASKLARKGQTDKQKTVPVPVYIHTVVQKTARGAGRRRAGNKK